MYDEDTHFDTCVLPVSNSMSIKPAVHAHAGCCCRWGLAHHQSGRHHCLTTAGCCTTRWAPAVGRNPWVVQSNSILDQNPRLFDARWVFSAWGFSNAWWVWFLPCDITTKRTGGASYTATCSSSCSCSCSSCCSCSCIGVIVDFTNNAAQ